MKKTILSFFFLSVVFLSSIKAQDYAASLKVSTLGLNLEAIRSFGEQFNARAGFAFFPYSANGGTKEYNYKAKAKLFSISALADYFPFDNSLRLTGGVIFNLNKGDINMVPAKSTTIGGDEYTPDKLGSLKADLDFNKVAPYLGIGIGNPTGGNSGFKFTFDIGTIYQGPAKVKLSATGLLEPSAAPDQEKQLESNLSWFKWYPVLSFGLVYKF